MEICKNKASGKYFLFIEETGDGKLLLVIPNGEVKALDPALFEDAEELDIDYCLNTGLIASQQIAGYKKFIEEDSVRLWQNAMRSDDNVPEQLGLALKRMSNQQREFVMQKLNKILAQESYKTEKTKDT